jgi:thiol-disulfide isomerase/thioredoxin
MKEVEVPDPPKDQNGNITDSSFQYRYYKTHYFDNFDISDVRLLRTPFYEKKLLGYLEKMIVPVPDSIYKEIDYLIKKSRTDTFLFKYMLATTFNHYANSNLLGMDAIYVYIAEKYFIPEASWVDPKFIQDLKGRIVKLKPLLIGKIAPDVQLVRVSDEHFKMAANDSVLKKNPYAGDFFNLGTVPAKFIILYFWESDCGHCQKTIPVLHKLYEKMKSRGLEVISVNMLSGIEGKVKWINFINSEKLYGWINAWNPYDFSYRDIYDINSSNILYLFDENKKIIAKRINPEQAEQIIMNELKRKNDKK